MPEQCARFCIDENSFRLETEDKNCLEDLLGKFISLIGRLRDDNQEIVRWSGLEFVNVFNGTNVSDLIYGNILDRDIKNQLMIILNRCYYWDDEFIPQEGTFIIEDIEHTGKSLEYVFEQVLNGQAFSCICVKKRNQIHGPHKVYRRDDQIEIHFLTNVEEITPFYRSVYEIENLPEEEYIGHAELAFPQLFFIQDIHRQFRRFKESYNSLRPKITKHLAVINDIFGNICEESNNNYQEICRKFDSRGVPISRESPNTRGNQRAMREREINVGGITLVCEWHTKLSSTYDRIHFHEGRPNVADGKIIIGIFSNHLRT